MENHPSVHERLTRLENAVQLLEERDQANLRRIEQLASRVRELEQPRDPGMIDYVEEMRERAGE